MVGDTAPVRASPNVLPLVAERRTVYAMGNQPDAATASQQVTRVILDEAEVHWTEADWHRFGAGMATRQFVLISDLHGVRVYARFSG
jgi:hypothetical protein